MYFADIYADRRLPEELRRDPILNGECLAGALYPKDFLELAKLAGFTNPRLVETSPIEINDPSIQGRIGPAIFCSATYRLFKINNLEINEEYYGQSAIYLGNIPEHPKNFHLDGKNIFPTGEACNISGNTSKILLGSRFKKNFELKGNTSNHLGGDSIDSYNNLPKFDQITKSSSCC